jgi:hypothetical protein
VNLNRSEVFVKVTGDVGLYEPGDSPNLGVSYSNGAQDEGIVWIVKVA